MRPKNIWFPFPLTMWTLTLPSISTNHYFLFILFFDLFNRTHKINFWNCLCIFKIFYISQSLHKSRQYPLILNENLWFMKCLTWISSHMSQVLRNMWWILKSPTKLEGQESTSNTLIFSCDTCSPFQTTENPSMSKRSPEKISLYALSCFHSCL